MALAPPLVAVDFTRLKRADGSLVGSDKKITAKPTVGRVTKAADHGFFDLPASTEATSGSADLSGVLLLHATDQNDESWGYRIEIEGEAASWLVSVPAAGLGGRTKTVNSVSYPAAYLTSLAVFTGPATGGGGGNVDLSTLYTKGQTDQKFADFLADLQNNDRLTQYEIDLIEVPRSTADSTPVNLLGKITRFDTSSAAISQALPAATPGRTLAIGWDAGTNTLTITRDGTDVIGAGSASSLVLPLPGEVITLHCTTAGRWRVMSGFKPQAALDARFMLKPDESGAAPGDVVAVGPAAGSYRTRTPAQLRTILGLDGKFVFLTPEMFGAVGDGVANDRPAFVAMAAAAAAAGRASVYVSKQHYLSDAINFDVEDIDFYLAAGSHIFTTAATSQGQTLGFIGYLGSGTAVSPRRNSVKVHGPGKVTGWLGGTNENAIGIVRYERVLVEGPLVNAGNKGVTAQIGCPDVRIRRITSEQCVNNVVSVEDQAASLRAVVEDVTFGTCGGAAVFGYGQRLEVRRIRGGSAHATSGSTSQGAVHLTAGGSTLAWAELSDIDIDTANTAKGVVVSTAQDGRADRIRIGASAGNALDIFNCPNGLAVSGVDAPNSPAGAVATGTTPTSRIRRSGRSGEHSRALVVGEATMDRIAINSATISAPTGVMRLGYFEATKTETITKAHVVTGASIPTGVTLFRIGVFTVADDDTLTLVASTPNDTALLAAINTGYDKALSASFVKRAGTRYAIGILGVYSGGSLQVPGSSLAGSIGTEAALAPRLTAAVGSLADLPASQAVTAAHGTAAMPYLVVKP